MKRFAGLLAGVFIAYSAPSAAETGFLDRSITVSGKTFRYQIRKRPKPKVTVEKPVVFSACGQKADPRLTKELTAEQQPKRKKRKKRGGSGWLLQGGRAESNRRKF